MALAIRSTSSGNTGSGATTTSIVVTAPAGVALNDIVVALSSGSSGTATLTATGFTQLDQTQNANGLTSCIFYKVASGAEPATYTFGISNTSSQAVVIYAISGGNTGTPIAAHTASAGTSATVSQATPTASATSAGELVLLFDTSFTSTIGATTTYTYPGGTTLDVQTTANATLTANEGASGGHENALTSSAGTVGGETITGSSAEFYNTHTIVLTPGDINNITPSGVVTETPTVPVATLALAGVSPIVTAPSTGPALTLAPAPSSAIDTAKGPTPFVTLSGLLAQSAFDPHTNFPLSTIAVAPSPALTGLLLTLQSGDAAFFPSAYQFNCVVWPAATQPTHANAEIVRVISITGDTYTVTRAVEGSTARAIGVGDQIAANITLKTLTDIENAISSVPTTLASGKTYTIGAGTQVLWAEGITVNGALVVNGSMRGVR